MNIFGFFIPWWVLLSAAFGAVYVLFTILGKVRERKIKAKRKGFFDVSNNS